MLILDANEKPSVPSYSSIHKFHLQENKMQAVKQESNQDGGSIT